MRDLLVFRNFILVFCRDFYFIDFIKPYYAAINSLNIFKIDIIF